MLNVRNLSRQTRRFWVIGRFHWVIGKGFV